MPKVGTLTRTLALAVVAATVAVAAATTAGASSTKTSGTTISGAGSTFVSPLVSTWVPAVGGALGYELQYSAIGSSGGINAITGRTVDFGASDAPLSPDQFTACKGCTQIPSALAAQTQGSIGYADVAFALKNHFSYFAMKNLNGKYATPGAKGILAAAMSDVKPTAGTNELSIVNPPKKFPLAYPISTYTYVIVPLQSSKAPDLRKFLFWAVTHGQEAKYTAPLRFVPIPKSVLVVAEKAIAKIHG